ncbi:MAG: hypothetical protein R2805_11340 [Flavobacterium sp.]|uniref:hypothetical protein n=1 Tax=Flavobacterium sp. TaxID=239 RepID=UPI003527AE25
MKTKLKKNSILFIILIATLFSSCEKELFDEAIRQEKSIIKKIDFKSFKGDIKASQKLERLHEITPNNETNRVEYNSDYDVYYDVDNIILITKENLKYYTIPLIKAENDSLVKNLVLSEKSDGTYKAKISAYKLTEEEIEKIKNGLIVDLNNKGYTKDFIENESRFSEYLSFSQFNQTPCVVSVITDVYCFSGQHEFGDPDCEVSELPPRVIIRYVYGLCDEGGTAGGGGSGNGNNNNNTTSPSQNNTEGQDDAITTPVIPSLDLSPIRLFVNSLSPDQLNWWNLIATDQEKINIENYVNQNTNVDEANEFALQFITQSYLNQNLTLDFEASKKSPANIDRSAIDKSTPEGAKFDLVYEQLMKSPKFKELFIDLFQNNDRFNVKFQIGAVPNGANGNTDTDLENPTLNLITISPQYLLSSNKMEIAKTIIHECIHAFLNVKLCDAGQGMSIPTLNNMDFYNVVNQEYNGFSPGQNQHNFIYNYMLPTMVTILSEVKDFLVSPADNTSIMSTVLHPNNPEPNPSQPFNWNDCYYYLSLGGLQNCLFFQNEIGTFNQNGSVSTVIDLIQMNLYNQYHSICHANLH